MSHIIPHKIVPGMRVLRQRQLVRKRMGLTGGRKIIRRRTTFPVMHYAREEEGGPEDVEKSGPPLSTAMLEWPASYFPRAFAISIRDERWRGMQARLGPWKDRVEHWRGTNGRLLRKRNWEMNGKCVNRCMLMRGQLGCHDSHTRLWEYMIEQNIPQALIMEDDANFRYHERTLEVVKQAFTEIEERNLEWDLLYLGKGTNEHRRQVAPHLVIPKTHQGLFCYVLTLRGARRLVRASHPYRIPVDVLAGNIADSNQIRALALAPKLCYVVHVRSDTGTIV